MNIFRIIIAAGVLLFIASGCSHPPRQPIAATHTIEQIQSQIGQVREGMTETQVISILGEPTMRSPLATKRDNVLVGTNWYYIAHMRDAQRFESSTDTYANVWFDANGLVRKVRLSEGRLES